MGGCEYAWAVCQLHPAFPKVMNYKCNFCCPASKQWSKQWSVIHCWMISTWLKAPISLGNAEVWVSVFQIDPSDDWQITTLFLPVMQSLNQAPLIISFPFSSLPLIKLSTSVWLAIVAPIRAAVKAIAMFILASLCWPINEITDDDISI